MLPSILHNPAFYATLLTIDLAYAAAAQKARCPYCGGLLHFARYERKPRAPISLGQEYCVRQSLWRVAGGGQRRVRCCTWVVGSTWGRSWCWRRHSPTG